MIPKITIILSILSLLLLLLKFLWPVLLTKKYTLTVSNDIRSYRLHLPHNYDPKTKYPLVVALHGYGANGLLMELITGFSRKADQENFIVVYPDGTKSKDYPRRSWNGGSCCGNGIINKVDDVKFIKDLTVYIKKNYPINNRKIYVTGFSNGAIMSYRLISELPGLFAAAGIGSGSIAGKTLTDNYQIPEPKRPTPLVIFHGTADISIPYNGGKNIKGDGDFASVKEGINLFLPVNGCSSKKEFQPYPKVIQIDYRQCKKNANITLYTVKDGNHVWFGGLDELYFSHILNNFSETDIIWNFFKAHPIE